MPLAEEHLNFEVELDSDPEVMRYLTGRGSSRETVEEQHRKRLAVAQRAPGLGVWAGFTTGRFVGWWLLGPPTRPERASNNEAELGYRLLRRFWRQGLASEGARELIRHGFDDLGLSRVFAETMVVNTASRATMVSVGLRYEQAFKRKWDDPLPNSELGEVEYAITRAAWSASPC